MFDRSSHHYGLEHLSASSPQGSRDEVGVTIEIQPYLGHFNLRGEVGDSEFVKAVRAVFGQDLPVRANTMTLDEHRIYWLGPNEWLIVTAIEGAEELMTRFRASLARLAASVTEVSGGQVMLRLGGSNVRDVLAKGCTLDFDSSEFQLHSCAQSGLAKTNVLVALVDEQPVYEIIVRRSFSEYLVLWLRHAAAEYCVTISVA